MIQLNDDNFNSTLSSLFREGKTAVVFYGSPNCPDCKKTMNNYKSIDTYSNKAFYFYVDMTECWIPENKYPELDSLTQYPKTMIFNGSFSDVEFRQGEFTVENFNEFQNSDKNS